MELSKEYLRMRAANATDKPVAGRRQRTFEARVPPAQVTGTTQEPTVVRIMGCEKQVAQAIRDAAKGKKVRHVFIEATFPELKGGQMYQHAHGEAAGSKAAISRAFKNLLKTIPKKRISVISAKISITTKIVEG